MIVVRDRACGRDEMQGMWLLQHNKKLEKRISLLGGYLVCLGGAGERGLEVARGGDGGLTAVVTRSHHNRG